MSQVVRTWSSSALGRILAYLSAGARELPTTLPPPFRSVTNNKSSSSLSRPTHICPSDQLSECCKAIAVCQGAYLHRGCTPRSQSCACSAIRAKERAGEQAPARALRGEHGQGRILLQSASARPSCVLLQASLYECVCVCIAAGRCICAASANNAADYHFYWPVKFAIADMRYSFSLSSYAWSFKGRIQNFGSTRWRTDREISPRQPSSLPPFPTNLKYLGAEC